MAGTDRNRGGSRIGETDFIRKSLERKANFKDRWFGCLLEAFQLIVYLKLQTQDKWIASNLQNAFLKIC